MAEPHNRGCSREGARPSELLAGYLFCPSCRRMVSVSKDDRDDVEEAPSLFDPAAAR